MEILHDWDDDRCVEILRGATLDMIMLALTGGRERTDIQLSDFLNHGGFSDGMVIETNGPLCIVEARAV